MAFDSNNQASSSQSATRSAAGGIDTAGAAASANSTPSVAPAPITYTRQQIAAMQASDSIPPSVQCAPVSGQCNPETASATGEKS